MKQTSAYSMAKAIIESAEQALREGDREESMTTLERSYLRGRRDTAYHLLSLIEAATPVQCCARISVFQASDTDCARAVDVATLNANRFLETLSEKTSVVMQAQTLLGRFEYWHIITITHVGASEEQQ